ncbi:MAG TPA: FtsX-like permease family protein [Pyrinomonadaceae bacterium]|nr:FtsX-like permease family protein [Pyrinomonadaceae bacterium]
MTRYYVKLAEPARAGEVAKAIEAALLANGVQATAIRDQLAENQRQSTGFLYIVQGFMGLGLVVGVAAVGVIAFRSVVERRQQIGVLRAIGYQRGLVALSLLIETAFVVGLGVLSGTALGLFLARNLFASDELGVEATAFLVPWEMIVVVLAATIVVALLMTWIPARQAARIAPAEALRYE